MTALIWLGLWLLALVGVIAWSDMALRAERGIGEAQLAARRALLATERQLRQHRAEREG